MIFNGKYKIDIPAQLINAKQNNLFSDDMNNIDWNIFDKIYCIHYLPYSERLQTITNKLKTLGILDLPQFSFYFTVPNKYYDFFFLDKFDNVDYSSIHIKNINLQINRFNLLKICNKLKYNRVLIIEDDILLLKDIHLIKKYIENFPLNYDIVNMDPWFYNDDNRQMLLHNANAYINDFYCDMLDVKMVFNASFISLSKKAIEFLISNIENKFRPMDNYIFHRNDTLNDKIKIAFSRKNLCIQNEISDRQDEFLSGKYKSLNMQDYEKC